MDFNEWIAITKELQLNGFHRDLESLEGDERADALHADITGMMSEVVEISNEIGWKPWVKNRGWYNHDEVMGEVVDLLHFVANVLVTCHIDGDQLADAYLSKVTKNYSRQARGDDGVDRICRNCHRSLDDVGTVILKHEKMPLREVTVCGACRYPLKEWP